MMWTTQKQSMLSAQHWKNTAFIVRINPAETMENALEGRLHFIVIALLAGQE